MKLKLTEINAAVDAAFNAAVAAPQRVAPQVLGENATLRTDVYTGPRGAGFAVAAMVDLGWRKLEIARQHGPEMHREQPAPTLEALVAECEAKRQERYRAEADPLFFKSQRGEATGAEWLAKVAQIRTEIPQPE